MAVQVASQLVAAYAELRQLPVVVQSLLDQLLQGGHSQAAVTVQDARLLQHLRAVRRRSVAFWSDQFGLGHAMPAFIAQLHVCVAPCLATSHPAPLALST